MITNFTTLICLFISLLHVIARPALVERDIYSPPITSPDSDTVWKVGQKVNVTWETADMPSDSELTRKDGTIYLGYTTPDSESLHLMIDSPLAKGFLLRSGSVQVTIPSVPTRSSYIVVLLGSSDNASPGFTIEGSSQPPASPSSTRSLSPSSSLTGTPSQTIWPSTTITDPIPITGTTITDEPTTTSPATTSSTSAGTSQPAGAQPTNGVMKIGIPTLLTFTLSALVCMLS